MNDEHHRKVAAAAARLMRRDHADYDDIMQEGAVAFWRAYDGEETVGLALHAAKLRMRHALATAPQRPFQPTGHEGLPGHIAAKTTAILDRPVGEDGSGTLADLMIPGIEALEGVEMAYHRAELAAALADLRAEDRAYVARRFWEGLTDSEIARELGVGTSTIHNRWARRIRPALLGALGHLQAA